MKNALHNLEASEISSEVFIINPSQIDFISEMFGNSVADTMNMRTFAPRIRQLARESLREALIKAKKQGAQ